ncbi:MAG: 3-oxoacyl-ACP synthase [Gammaproteobacteria bacterium TMED78]|nr:MAG: 3-oxoacyl-ACP synthase [Gammaproteobacteria bacterium TMED78]|tara:strand:- start:685 stop:1644 length:960 start_codon:yes stop_codon:yes gene_type:complete
MYSKIIGTGSYLPDRILSNTDLEKIVDTSDQWIVSRTGVRQRHIASDDQLTSDLAYEASLLAIESAGIEPNEIDMIIVGTCTPDLIFPNVGTILQEKLGVRGIPSFSLEAACTGFIYALTTADQFIRTGHKKRILVVGAEVISRILDWNDRETCVLFGDGAGAVIIEASEKPGIIYSNLASDGSYRDLLYASGGMPSKKGVFEDATIHMKGKEVFRVAVKTLGSMVDEVLKNNNLNKSDIDWLVPHQANLRIIKAAAEKLDMPMEKVVVTVSDHANTSAATIPTALDTAIKDGRIKKGDLLLLEAFGAGFTWGASLVRY